MSVKIKKFFFGALLVDSEKVHHSWNFSKVGLLPITLYEIVVVLTFEKFSPDPARTAYHTVFSSEGHAIRRP